MAEAGVASGPLFQPGEIGGLPLKNRIVLAPMTRISAEEDGRANAAMAAHYARYARGGFGLLITEGTYPDTLHSQCYLNQPGLATPDQAASWTPVVEAVHAEGVPIFAQLMHGGAVMMHNRFTDTALAPSAVQPKGEMPPRYHGQGPYPVPRAASPEDIAAVIEGFATAARHAVEAGFDGVEIHGANGYLIDNFLTDYTNRRTDAYGGSTANRGRLAVEVAEAIRAAVPQGFPVGIRISQSKVNDFDHVWEGGASDAETIFSALGRTGVSYIHVSSHLGCGPVFGTDQPLAGLARRHAGVPVIANGRLENVDTAEEVLSRGQADFVSVAKAALADPDWPNRIAAGLRPVAFDPGVITPLATYDCEAAWRAALPED
ncbi:NADH:flavin oxidoreductase [Histidinibacterium lentulum]|uniref:NADH:flavin oxidoreductase n=1 Tax=Histidinibacterium lentulum TaxID=2480588 RepID=A0A3N2R8J9_9RHOB|nr:NADH:flavin oxidoreductase [Histidinibacterium lentulum]ROU03794.1 NADH:flavin oxidoreductase [Histidinibacterium lentulum]